MNKVSKLLCALLAISLLALPLVGCAKPLTVNITAPTDGSTVDKSPLEVRGFVSNPKATVWVNDTTVPVSKKGFYSTKVELAEGENTIKVVAARGKAPKWKEVVNSTATVTYKPSG